MKAWTLFCIGLLYGVSASAAVKVEQFTNTVWQHHETLGTRTSTADLVFEVQAGGDMRGITQPARALYPGFNPNMKVKTLSISAVNGKPFNFRGIAMTDLFQMPIAQVKIEAIRNGAVDNSDTVGPLWSNLTQSGVAFTFTDFDNVERIDISSDTTDDSQKDFFAFIDSVDYEVDEDNTPSEPETTDTPTPLTSSSSENSSSSNNILSLEPLTLFTLCFIGWISTRQRRH